jgi:hypothetical protein
MVIAVLLSQDHLQRGSGYAEAARHPRAEMHA